jgi:hypothetical protein
VCKIRDFGGNPQDAETEEVRETLSSQSRLEIEIRERDRDRERERERD